jgi:hypothetical protein
LRRDRLTLRRVFGQFLFIDRRALARLDFRAFNLLLLCL